MYEEINYSKEVNDSLIDEYYRTGKLDLDTLIINNIPFARKISFAFRNSIVFDSALDIEDIVQVGCIGLIKAAHNFSPEKGYSFCTYAGEKIKWEIMRWFRDNSSGGYTYQEILSVYTTL